jgi:hypothetical protein
MNKMSEIQWDDMLGGAFVKLVTGTPSELVVKNWRPQDKFMDEKTGNVKPGVVFEVIEENGKEVNKTWTLTAIKGLVKLRPILENAEEQGSESVKLSVLRVGEGRQTVYDIKQV